MDEPIDDTDGPAPDKVDEVWQTINEHDQRFLVNEIMFKGLVTLLVEKGIFTKDEITAHLLDVPDFQKLHRWRQDAMPAFEQALGYLWKD